MRETWEHQPDAGPVAMVDGEWQPLGTTEHGATFREVIERETVQSLADAINSAPPPKTLDSATINANIRELAESWRAAQNWEMAASAVAAIMGVSADCARRALSEFAKTAGATPQGAIEQPTRMAGEYQREARVAAERNFAPSGHTSTEPPLPPLGGTIKPDRPHHPKRKAHRRMAKASRKANR